MRQFVINIERHPGTTVSQDLFDVVVIRHKVSVGQFKRVSLLTGLFNANTVIVTELTKDPLEVA